MKKFMSALVICLAAISQASFACDEQCARDKVAAEKNVKFPSYLTWKYCEGIAMDFMTSAMRSLDNYRNNHFETKYKGPLKNTKSFLVQRKSWLEECDKYMSMTKGTRIFNDDKTTKQIFASIDGVNTELRALIKGVSYSASAGVSEKTVINERFNSLFKHVDNHKTIMHLKGKYVVR